MKAIIVNAPDALTERQLQKIINQTVSYFGSRRVRNRQTLLLKKEITLVFLTSTKMKKINHQYRKKNKATDILSFSSADKNSLGELLLCLPVLARQAREQKHSLLHETTYMLVHGVLHLLGYDHELSRAEDKLMMGLQDACYKQILLNMK